MNSGYELVRLPNGSFSIHSRADQETFHPIAGPIAEADALYVRQLRLRERLTSLPNLRGAQDEFVIWDIGLGAGGNAFTALRRLGDLSARVRIVSFDRTLDALRAAQRHAHELQFPLGFEEPLERLLSDRTAEFMFGNLHVHWEIHLADFPSLLASAATGARVPPAPHAIFFDAFSPARNPEMWTLPLFQDLHRLAHSCEACSLATFSRSTMARVAMLLAGFFVGMGTAVAGKEETTIAANCLAVIERPLDAKWLDRARISQSAEPLASGVYRQAPLSAPTYERLRKHPQFAR